VARGDRGSDGGIAWRLIDQADAAAHASPRPSP
jgi:hypothetical protein